MEKENNYPGKILLFGEYTVLSGGSALVIPFHEKSGYFDFLTPSSTTEHVASNANLKEFLVYLSGIKLSHFNFSLFNKEIDEGIFFNSTIPENYGIGSSGALTAAVYDRYVMNKLTDSPEKLKIVLATMESFFHGTSSGIDPLCCLIQQPVFFSKISVEIIKLRSNKLDLQLFDTGTRRSTSNYVEVYLKKYANATFKSIVENQLKPSVEKAIAAYLVSNSDVLLKEFKNISSIQFEHFKEMIPENVLEKWQKGLVTEKYFLKLCGAGGGGYLLAIGKFR